MSLPPGVLLLISSSLLPLPPSQGMCFPVRPDAYAQSPIRPRCKAGTPSAATGLESLFAALSTSVVFLCLEPRTLSRVRCVAFALLGSTWCRRVWSPIWKCAGVNRQVWGWTQIGQLDILVAWTAPEQRATLAKV
ncbi:hypothetical protein VZT92_014499 [Zoarces viviparus]|uniref:Secreted protein n=1 Tax=Zoarces viviparus TaxID=48416 RepID=A0AAW1F2W5_ZOAVI